MHYFQMQKWVVHQKQKVQQHKKMLQNQKKMQQKKMLQNQKKVQQQQKQKMLQNQKKKMLQHSQLQHYWAETSAWRRQSPRVGVARVQAAKEGEARWGKQRRSFNLKILMKLPKRFWRCHAAPIECGKPLLWKNCVVDNDDAKKHQIASGE